MSGGGLNDNMNIEIKSGGAIYVYYDNNGNNLHQPKVICISKNGPSDTANNTWYIAGSDECSWSFSGTGINNKKDPTEVTADDLTKAKAGEINIPGTTYVIKLDKRPLTAGDDKKIKYRTKGTDIEVEKKDGDDDKVPTGYVRYKHEGNISDPKIKHNGFELELSPNPTGNVSAVYVYYEKTNDTKHEFPLIVCVKSATFTYYKRGNEWTRITDTNLDGKDPETLEGTNLTTLEQKLGEVKVLYEVKLEKDNTGDGKYFARPGTDEADKITVTEVSENGGFKGFKHQIPASKKINRITIHGHITDGIEDSVLTSQQFNTTGGVFVYFEINDANTKREKPLLICLSQDGRANATTNKWYKRKPDMTWQEETTGYDQIPPGPSINPTLKGKLGTIKGELNPRGNKDTGYLNFASHFNSHINP